MNEPLSEAFRRDAIDAINALRMIATAYHADGNSYEASAVHDRQLVTMRSRQCSISFDRSQTELHLRMTPIPDRAPGFAATTVSLIRESFPGSPLFTKTNEQMAFDPKGYAGTFSSLMGDLDASTIVMENLLGQQEYATIRQISQTEPHRIRERVDLAARALDRVLGGRYISLVRMPAMGSPGTVRIRDLNDVFYPDPQDMTKESTVNYLRFATFIRAELESYPPTLMLTRREDRSELFVEPLQYAIGVTPPEEQGEIYRRALEMTSR